MLRLLTVIIAMLVFAVHSYAQSFRQAMQRESQRQNQQQRSNVENESLPGIKVWSVRADELPDDLFYVLKGTNLYQVWKGENGDWGSAWAVCATEKKDGRVRFNITWDSGSDEIGDLEDGVYTIQEHTSDDAQTGRKHSMREVSLPSSAVSALNNAIKDSIPLNTSKQDLKIANDHLDVAEQGFSVRTPRAFDARGILRRRRQIMQNLELENAKLILDAVN